VLPADAQDRILQVVTSTSTAGLGAADNPTRALLGVLTPTSLQLWSAAKVRAPPLSCIALHVNSTRQRSLLCLRGRLPPAPPPTHCRDGELRAGRTM